MSREDKGHSIEGAQGQRSTHHTLIIKEARTAITERVVTLPGDNHIQRHQTLKEARTAITGRVATLPDTQEVKIHPTPTMKRQMVAVIEEAGKGTVIVADIEKVTRVGIETMTIGIETVTPVRMERMKNQDHRAQVVERVGGPKEIGEEGDIEEVVEAATRVGGREGIREEGENEGVVGVEKDENGKKI